MTGRARRPPGRPPGGRRVVDAPALLDAAERVIGRGGQSASLEAIAEEAGVTKPVIYSYVGDRQALVDALSERMADRIVTASASAVQALGPAVSQRALVARLIESALSAIAADRELFLYVSRGRSSDEPVRALLLAERSAEALAAMLAGSLTRQGRDPQMATPWAYAIVGMLNLVALWWTQTADRTAEALANDLTELLWPGIGGETYRG